MEEAAELSGCVRSEYEQVTPPEGSRSHQRLIGNNSACRRVVLLFAAFVHTPMPTLDDFNDRCVPNYFYFNAGAVRARTRRSRGNRTLSITPP